MQFIDEENDMTIFFNVIDDVVHPLLEVSARASSNNYIHQVSSKTRILAVQSEPDQLPRWSQT